MKLTIKIPDSSDDEKLKRAIKNAIKLLLKYNRRWVLTKPNLGPKWLKWQSSTAPPEPRPWSWDYSRYESKLGCDMRVSDLERILGYSSVGNYNSYLFEGSSYVWKYRKTALSTIMKHLKDDIRSMKIVMEDASR